MFNAVRGARRRLFSFIENVWILGVSLTDGFGMSKGSFAPYEQSPSAGRALHASPGPSIAGEPERPQPGPLTSRHWRARAGTGSAPRRLLAPAGRWRRWSRH